MFSPTNLSHAELHWDALREPWLEAVTVRLSPNSKLCPDSLIQWGPISVAHKPAGESGSIEVAPFLVCRLSYMILFWGMWGFFCFLGFCDRISLCSTGCSWTHYVTHLFQPPACWDYRMYRHYLFNLWFLDLDLQSIYFCLGDQLWCELSPSPVDLQVLGRQQQGKEPWNRVRILVPNLSLLPVSCEPTLNVILLLCLASISASARWDMMHFKCSPGSNMLHCVEWPFCREQLENADALFVECLC